MTEPPRVLAFLLLALAIGALSLPIVYTFYEFEAFSRLGKFLAAATVVVAAFGILTVLVSVIRFFRTHRAPERRNL